MMVNELNSVTVASSATATATVSSGVGIIISLPLESVEGLCTLLVSRMDFNEHMLQKEKRKTQGETWICKELITEPG